jgi:arylsulfatase
MSFAPAEEKAAQKPNILVIMADDLGFSDIGALGGEISTPNLDALAREGRIQTSVYAPPMPHLAHAEFLFGVDHHVIVSNALPGVTTAPNPGVDRLRMPVAKLLRDAGYHTYMIGTWDLGSSPETNPALQGFESSHALLSMAGDYFPPDGKNVPLAREGFRYTDNGAGIPVPAGYITDVWAARLIADIARNKDDGKPFFAYAAFTSPHFPLQAPDSLIDKYRGKYDTGYDAVRQARLARQKALGLFAQEFPPANPVSESLGYKTWENLTEDEKRFEARRMEVYAAMVENLDWNVGRIVRSLKESGLFENTLIVFTASSTGAQSVATHRSMVGIDNRLENLGRKNSWISYTERWAEVSNAPFSRWKAKTTEGGIVMPFIVRLPGQKSTHRVSEAIAFMRDLPATFLDVAGLPAGARASVLYTGKSLLGLWEGKMEAVHDADAVFVEEHRDEAYVRQGKWKAVFISDTAINAFDGSDPARADYLAAVKVGDMKKANEIRAAHPSRWQLYDIKADRGETNDLAKDHPEILQGLIAHYDVHRQTHAIPAPYSPAAN